MLATCWQHAGNNKAFPQGPEAFIVGTGGPFENCPLSSGYSVLLGARLGANRVQKVSYFLLLELTFSFECCVLYHKRDNIHDLRQKHDKRQYKIH